MDGISSYLFWASIYMVVTALFHLVAVRHFVTPSQARWFILTGKGLSLLIPALVFFPVNQVSTAFAIQGNILPEVVVGASEGVEVTRQEVIRVLGAQKIIISGAMMITLVLLVRMLLGIIYLISQIAGSSLKCVNGCKLIPLKKDISPYSFFSYVFVSERLLHQKELHPILLHEQGHIRKMHSIDLIFIELISVLFWFNPAVWYLRRAIKHHHEYEADQYVLHQKFDKLSYQKLLVSLGINGFAIPLITPFNYPPIKKRIMMMNRNFSGFRVRAIFSMLFAVPVFAAVFFMQSCTAVDDPVGQDESVVSEHFADETIADDRFFDDVIFTVADQPPRFPGGEQARMAFMQEFLRYPETARDEGIQGTVFVSFVVRYDGSVTDVEVLRGIGGGCDEEARRVVSMMPQWEPGMRRGEPVSVQFNLPVRFTLNQGSSDPEPETTGDAYFYLDGKLYSLKDADFLIDNLITPDEIESIHVLTGDYALERFGKERVLLLERKQ